MDYEIYNFKIENLSNKTIKINSLKKPKTMYLEDSSGNTYNAYSHEIYEEELEVNAKNNININIKYANTYSEKNKIGKIVFEDIILDYVEYKKIENIEQFEDICKLTIYL